MQRIAHLFVSFSEVSFDLIPARPYLTGVNLGHNLVVDKPSDLPTNHLWRNETRT